MDDIIEVLFKAISFGLITTAIVILFIIADYTHDRVKDLREELKAGEEVEVKMIHFDRKTRQLHVSHKVLEKRPEDGSTTRKISEEPTKTTLGDLLKEQMKKEDE